MNWQLRLRIWFVATMSLVLVGVIVGVLALQGISTGITGTQITVYIGFLLISIPLDFVFDRLAEIEKKLDVIIAATDKSGSL